MWLCAYLFNILRLVRYCFSMVRKNCSTDIEQRNGRIIRQGNENPVIGVYNYVTENTFDAYLMNIIVTKQRFISQLMSGKAAARSCEDVDEAVLNYSEMQALASGDDRIKSY